MNAAILHSWKVRIGLASSAFSRWPRYLAVVQSTVVVHNAKALNYFAIGSPPVRITCSAHLHRAGCVLPS